MSFPTEGIYRIEINATDNAGWETPPTILLLDTTNGSTHPAATLFNYSINDSGGSGIKEIYYMWDNNPEKTEIDPLPALEGLHTLQVNVKDYSGHWTNNTYEFYTLAVISNFTEETVAGVFLITMVIVIYTTMRKKIKKGNKAENGLKTKKKIPEHRYQMYRTNNRSIG